MHLGKAPSSHDLEHGRLCSPRLPSSSDSRPPHGVAAVAKGRFPVWLPAAAGSARASASPMLRGASQAKATMAAPSHRRQPRRQIGSCDGGPCGPRLHRRGGAYRNGLPTGGISRRGFKRRTTPSEGGLPTAWQNWPTAPASALASVQAASSHPGRRLARAAALGRCS
jgi:hypothetical protein